MWTNQAGICEMWLRGRITWSCGEVSGFWWEIRFVGNEDGRGFEKGVWYSHVIKALSCMYWAGPLPFNWGTDKVLNLWHARGKIIFWSHPPPSLCTLPNRNINSTICSLPQSKASTEKLEVMCQKLRNLTKRPLSDRGIIPSTWSVFHRFV